MKIKNILLSQIAPEDFEKSPYANLKKKYSINIDFYKFFRIETISGKEFRAQKINVLDHTAIIFFSKNTIDAFFSLMDEVRVQIPETMKYYCTTDAIAFYLQKYIQYRKRKIFFGKNSTVAELCALIKKNHESNFLIPCSSLDTNNAIDEFIEKWNIKSSKLTVFRTVANDIKSAIGEKDIHDFDLIVFFSPFGIQALKENFPDFEQKEICFGALGEATAQAIENAGWTMHLKAPTKESPSITSAIDIFCKAHAIRRR